MSSHENTTTNKIKKIIDDGIDNEFFKIMDNLENNTKKDDETIFQSFKDLINTLSKDLTDNNSHTEFSSF